MTRWTIEETFRFIKQSYQLEDIRLLTYVRLQNMMAFVLADGIKAYLFGQKRGLSGCFSSPNQETGQRCLFSP